MGPKNPTLVELKQKKLTFKKLTDDYILLYKVTSLKLSIVALIHEDFSLNYCSLDYCFGQRPLPNTYTCKNSHCAQSSKQIQFLCLHLIFSVTDFVPDTVWYCKSHLSVAARRLKQTCQGICSHMTQL